MINGDFRWQSKNGSQSVDKDAMINLQIGLNNGRVLYIVCTPLTWFDKWTSTSDAKRSGCSSLKCVMGFCPTCHWRGAPCEFGSFLVVTAGKDRYVNVHMTADMGTTHQLHRQHMQSTFIPPIGKWAGRVSCIDEIGVQTPPCEWKREGWLAMSSDQWCVL